LKGAIISLLSALQEMPTVSETMNAFPRQSLLWVLPLLLLVRSCSGQGQALAGGRFTTTTDVTSWLNLANDAADIRESDDDAEQEDIYVNVSFGAVYFPRLPLCGGAFISHILSCRAL